MSKLENPFDHHSSTTFEFSGITSILIGVYIIIGAFLTDEILIGFLQDGNPMQFMSPQIIEILIFLILFFVFIFSSLAFLFAGRRKAKVSSIKLWNQKNKTIFRKFMIGVLLLFSVSFLISKNGNIHFITPVFLLLLGVLILFLRTSTNKNAVLFIGICGLLSLVCFVIPMYWYSALTILGASFVTYGLVVK